jgi:nitric oxide synthase-interacting protein
LSNILAQKKELKRAEKARREAQEESARAKAAEDDEDTKRAIHDFELTQAGLTDHRQKRSNTDQGTSRDQEAPPAQAGVKRKFSLDKDELMRIAKEDKAKARKAIEDEKVFDLFSLWSAHLCILRLLLIRRIFIYFSIGRQTHASFVLDAVSYARCAR